MVENFNEVVDSEPAEQVAGRFVGLVVFLVGIAILVLTFALTYQAFKNTDAIISSREIAEHTVTNLTPVVIKVVLRFLLLIAMGYIGSLIAARGAQFFLSARKENRRAIVGD